MWAHYIRKKYNLGKFFYLDWWPLGPRWLFIADPEIASKFMTTGQSLHKSHLETDFINILLGKNNLVSLEGAHWKYLRSVFNPGFSAAHIMTLTPYVVDASLVFCENLHGCAANNTMFELEEQATNMTIDIIGKLVLDSDLNAQRAPHPIVTTMRERTRLMPHITINILSGFTPLRVVKLWLNGRKLDRLIGEEFDKRLAQRRAERDREREPSGYAHTDVKVSSRETTGIKQTRKLSIVDLAIDMYLQETQGSQQRGKPLATFRRDVVDSMKTFFFAGHDTTSSTIAYVFYLLHLYPDKYAKVAAELDAVFGSYDGGDTAVATVANTIKDNPHVINKLEYTTAVLKETLRLFPPASTMRAWTPGMPHSEIYDLSPSGVDVDDNDDDDRGGVGTGRAGRRNNNGPHNGPTYTMRGFEIWPLAHLIHRNEAFFPDPAEFVPERFLAHQTPYPSPEKSLLFTRTGRDAWRPFEKGPRSCIGQELAMIESKIIMALTLREFDFTPEFPPPPAKPDTETAFRAVEMVDETGEGRDRMTVEGHRAYQVLFSSAKPAGGMPGRVRLRGARR